MKLLLPWHKRYFTSSKGEKLFDLIRYSLDIKSSACFVIYNYNHEAYFTFDKNPYKTLEIAKREADKILIKRGYKLIKEGEEDKYRILL